MATANPGEGDSKDFGEKPDPVWTKVMEKLSVDENPEGSQTTSTDTAPDGPDFSELPDVVWVNVMKFLSLPDRARVSQTCHALRDVFNHPSLWYSVEIYLLGAMERYGQSKVLLPKKYKHMVERFGAYFQDLTLIITWFFTRFPQECIDVLEAMSSNCRLHTLTLSCGTIRTKRDVTTGTTRTADLEILTNIIARAFRMNTFILKAWPVYENLKAPNIIDVLCNNDKIDDLETLSLFWQSASESTWATLNAQLPSPDSMLKTVFHFRNLRSLSLRSTMINNAVIEELAAPKRTPLQHLGILLTYYRQDPNGGIPDISNKAWELLKTKCMEIEIDVTVVTRIPYVDLHGFLKPDIPLASISFMKYSRCTREDLSSLADKYHKTLKEFVDYSDGENVDNHIVGLVTRSTNLVRFLFNGVIHLDTVLHLARLRGLDWQNIQVNFDNISAQNRDVDYDENAVIVRGDDGSVNIAQRVESLDETLQEAMKEDLVGKVSKAIGRKWNPLNRKIVEAGHDETDIGIVPQAVADKILEQN